MRGADKIDVGATEANLLRKRGVRLGQEATPNGIRVPPAAIAD
jgi:hypothetical protein